MASINGIETKNVRTFPNKEGCPICEADVWYNGKKLGHWQQDYSCGPDDFDFNESLLQKEVEAYRQSDLIDENYRSVASLSGLLEELVNLKEKEKIAKRYYKQGYRTVVFLWDYFHMTYYATVQDRETALASDHCKEVLAKMEAAYPDVKIEVSAYEAKDFAVTLTDKEPDLGL